MMPFSRGMSILISSCSLFVFCGAGTAFAHDAFTDEFVIRGALDSKLLQYGAIVFAKLGSRCADRSRRAGKPRHHMMHRERAHVRVRVIRDELALDDMRIIHDL